MCIFLNRVLEVLPRLLGKSFFVAKKQPIPVKISRKSGDWGSQIIKARDATYLHLGKGPCSSLKVGDITICTCSGRETYDDYIRLLMSFTRARR